MGRPASHAGGPCRLLSPLRAATWPKIAPKSRIFPQKYSHTSRMISEAKEPYTKVYREDRPINQEKRTEQATMAREASRDRKSTRLNSSHNA